MSVFHVIYTDFAGILKIHEMTAPDPITCAASAADSLRINDSAIIGIIRRGYAEKIAKTIAKIRGPGA